jgi:hypothetical protein
MRIPASSLLVIRGTKNQVLQAFSLRQIFDRARPPKALRLLQGAHHGLDAAREQVLELLVGWISEWLSPCDRISEAHHAGPA